MAPGHSILEASKNCKKALLTVNCHHKCDYNYVVAANCTIICTLQQEHLRVLLIVAAAVAVAAAAAAAVAVISRSRGSCVIYPAPLLLLLHRYGKFRVPCTTDGYKAGDWTRTARTRRTCTPEKNHPLSPTRAHKPLRLQFWSQLDRETWTKSNGLHCRNAVLVRNNSKIQIPNEIIPRGTNPSQAYGCHHLRMSYFLQRL